MTTLLFLIIGLIGLAVLLVSVLADGVLDFLEFDTPFLSSTAIGAFMAGFGFTGLLLPDWGVSTVLAALAAGGLLAALAGLMIGFLRNGKTDETVTGRLALGSSGTVVSPIRGELYGEVMVTVAGHLMKYNAKADEDLPAGTPVMVIDILSPSAVRVTAL